MKPGNLATSQERIMVAPDILAGKPVIRGTRISVELVIDLLASGSTTDEILRNYPRLTRADILACLNYASLMLQNERVYPVPA